MKKYIVWDFDGTIVNTNNIIIESWQASFRHYLGHELPVREIEATFGEVLMDTISKKVPSAPVDEVVNYYRAFQDSHQDDIEVYAFDGIRDVINELRKKGCLIGVGTSRTEYSLINYIKRLGLEGCFDEIVTVNDVTRHKPHPETIEAVLLKLMAHDKDEWEKAAPESTEDGFDLVIPDEVRKKAIMIGDTKYDIGCANNAGVDSVLVGWSHYVDEEDMKTEGFFPTYRISKPMELLELI